MEHVKRESVMDSRIEALPQVSLLPGLVTVSSAMRRVAEQVLQVSPFECNVLLQGESGVGKELIARAIHEKSARGRGPFVPVHCGAIPRELLESELFGYERGAFTGAVVSRGGKVEMARGGTLFLDEIGTMDLGGQVRLLRVIQEKEVLRLGSSQVTKINSRFIAASNQDLREAVLKGEFREDLYYRLNVFPIEVPPLRERKEDIPYLVASILQELQGRRGILKKSIAGSALEKLENYPWPGNVRELKNLLERACIVEEGETLGLDHWEPQLDGGFPTESFLQGSLHLGNHRRSLEKRLVQKALLMTGHSKSLAAHKLGITPRGLRYKLKTLGL
ncbi:MAG: sigma-54-dependent Fis family transcriptional regulator [Deltaproteobacteria bacterium]|nr:sigma-54-dependent Fis family transcriptional regulator [Deltaproteobacteria bacterium]